MDSLEYSEFGTGRPFTYNTQYGWQWETRFADSGVSIVGLVEWVAFVGRMEKGMFLPSFQVWLVSVGKEDLSLRPEPTYLLQDWALFLQQDITSEREILICRSIFQLCQTNKAPSILQSVTSEMPTISLTLSKSATQVCGLRYLLVLI